ncbi:MAG: TlpA family protein disulfide reductase [Solirubrobacterales bacterium]
MSEGEEAGRDAPRDGSEPRPSAPSGFRPGARYSLFVGLAFVGVIAVAAINGFNTDEGTLLGTEPVRGEPLAEFAIPDVRGPLDLDANIAQDDCATAENPCPESDRRNPACEIEPKGAIRVCDLFDRPLVISFWFTTPRACVETQDEIYDLAARFRGQANFLSVAIRGNRADVEETVDERGWDVPVGWDRDGAVSNVYRVGVCPTVGVARPGGIFEEVLIGDDATPGRIESELEGLVAGSGRDPGGEEAG